MFRLVPASAFAAASIALVSAAPPPASPGSADPIPLVYCPKDGGSYSTGTAFRIGPGLLVTARHVARDGPCTIDGHPMRVLYVSPELDFAEVEDDQNGRYLHFDCSGFVEGRRYDALGHARGLAQITRVELLATGLKSDSGTNVAGMSILIGVFISIPGQSGGPIVDPETGDAVGIVNASIERLGASASVALADTPLCKGKYS